MTFLLMVLGVVVLLHLYLWFRLVRVTTRPGRGRRFGTLAIVGLALLLIAALVLPRFVPHAVGEVVAWPGYLWIAVMFYLFLTLLVLEVPALVARAWLWWADPDRRRAAAIRAAHEQGELDTGELVGVGVEAVPGEPLGRALGSAGGTGVGTGTGPTATDSPQPGDSESDDSRETTAHTRRLFLARAVAISAGLVAVGTTAYGTQVALGRPAIRRVQVPLGKLPRSADGLRIALVSDIHLGPIRGRSFTEWVVQAINDLGADLVAVVGDLVDGSVEELSDAVAPLRDLRSRLGSYFVTGNHEYFSGFEEWVEEVTHLGLNPLRNERVELPRGLDLAGVNDVTGRSYGDGPDFGQALQDRDPTRPVVLLAHQPIQAPEAARNGVDLQLSGHTHGGQLWPFNYVVQLQQPVVTGLGEVDGMPVYVTNGAGFWGPPVRIGATPDISLVELRSLA